MTLNEYSNLNKASFCYWVEIKLKDLGGIRGQSAFKFGIFEYKQKTTLKIASFDEK